MSRIRRHSDIGNYVVFLFFFCLYLNTMSTEIYTADCGELTTVGYVLSIPHPTGYSVYSILIKGFSMFIPLGSIAYRASLVSAFFGALTILFLRKILAFFFNRFAASSASIIFGLSLTFWSQTTIQEVYALHLCLICGLILTYINWIKTDHIRYFYLFGFFTGLSISHHLLTIFALPAVLIDLILFNRIKNISLKSLSASCVLAFLGWSSIIYQPIRSLSEPSMMWFYLGNVGNFLFHITGKQFRPIMFHTDLTTMAHNFSLFLLQVSDQWSVGVIILLVIGLYYLFFNKRRLFLYAIVFFFSIILFVINYEIVDIEVYYVQAYIPMIFTFGAGIFFIAVYINRLQFRKILHAILFLITFYFLSNTFLKNYYQNDRSNNFLAYDYGLSVYNSLKQDAVLSTQGWSSPFVFSYLDHVLQYRSDVINIIDYKFEIIRKGFNDNWKIPISSTVQAEILGLEDLVCYPRGLIYDFSRETIPQFDLDQARHFIRTRSFISQPRFLDMHGIALISKYYYLTGEYYLLKNDIDTACLYLDKAAQLGKTNYLILSNLSAIYFKMGRWAEAEKFARFALEKKPFFYQAHFNLGNALFMQGKYEEAAKNYNKVGDFGVSQGRKFQALGFSLLKEGNYKKAVIELNRANNLNPNSTEIQVNLAFSLTQTGKYAESKKILLEILKRNKNQIEAWNNLAINYLAAKNLVQAEKSINMTLKLNPELIDAKINQGILWGLQNKFEQSEDLFLRLLSNDPDNTKILNNLATLYFTQNKIDQAVNMWELSLKMNPAQIKLKRIISDLKNSPS